MSKKTANKTGTTAPETGNLEPRFAVSPRNGARIPLGAHPGNTGGKKGRSGRKPGWFKEFAGEVLSDPKVQEAIKARARDRKANGYWEGIRVLGRAAGEILDKYPTADGGGEITFRIVREENWRRPAPSKTDTNMEVP